MLYIRDSSDGLINGPPSYRLRHCTGGISGLDRREHSTGASRFLLVPHKWVNRARAVYASVSDSAASLDTPLTQQGVFREELRPLKANGRTEH